MGLPKLRLEGIKKSFTRNGTPLEVLKEISLEVEESEFVCMIGPSGCGKSTLFNIISGLTPSDEGQIYLDGHAVKDCQGEIAYMQQKDLLLPWRRVLDNAILGMEIKAIPRDEAKEKARVLFEKFGLKSFEERYPAELSGGMRQRIALIRTVLFEKDVLLLDEPFGALDAMTRSVMHSWLLRVWEEFGKTIFFVTHDIEEAGLLSNRVYVLTSRPMRVKERIDVHIPRPRDPTDPSFVALKGRLYHALQGEMKEAFYEKG